MDISDRLSEQELDAFASILLDGGRDGHYSKEFCNISFCRNYLGRVHNNLIVLNYDERQGLLMVFRVNGNAVCFSLMCSSPFPQFDAEILLFSVAKDQRRKGHGKMAIKLLLGEAQGKRVIARCMPKSTHMVQLLRNCGFVQIDMGKSKNINLAYLNG